MFFCNMLGSAGVGTFGRDNKVKFCNKIENVAEGAVISVKDNVATVESNGDGKSLFLKGVNGVGNIPYNEKINKKLTMADVVDNEANPVLVCLCSEISVYDGIPADIKIMPVGDEYALVALISGKIDINGQTLVRSVVVPEVEKAKKTFKASGFSTFGNFVDDESDYNYFMDAVHHIRISYNKRQESIGYMNVKEDIEYLTEQGIILARARAAMKRERDEQRRLKKVQEEKERKEQLERAEKAKQEAKEKAEANQRKADAQAFLRAMLG